MSRADPFDGIRQLFERAQAATRDEIRDARASQDGTRQHPGEKRGIMSGEAFVMSPVLCQL